MAVSVQEQAGETLRSPSLFDILEIRGPLERPPNILDRLKDSDRRRVLSRIHRVKLEPRSTLFQQGEWNTGIYIVETGLIRTFYTSPTGREITLAYWPPDNLVGGPDVFGESIHMWSGMAVKTSNLIAIKGDDLRALMEEIPQLAIGVVEALVYKGKCFSSLIQMLGTRSVSERLAQLLLMLVEMHGERDVSGGIAIRRQFTHQDLAHMVGASRQWVTTTLDRLQRQGVVHIRKRQVVVLQPDILAGRQSS
ncbi:MAG: Crp/Fnr family transcriptional regulator [Methyloligellaceae bacterium]